MSCIEVLCIIFPECPLPYLSVILFLKFIKNMYLLCFWRYMFQNNRKYRVTVVHIIQNVQSVNGLFPVDIFQDLTAILEIFLKVTIMPIMLLIVKITLLAILIMMGQVKAMIMILMMKFLREICLINCFKAITLLMMIMMMKFGATNVNL